MRQDCKHQHLHKDLKRPLERLKTQPGVLRIVLGPTENCRHRYSAGALKITRDTENGFQLNGYTGNGVIRLFLYLEAESFREKVRLILENGDF